MLHRWLVCLVALGAAALLVGPGVASAATPEGAVVSNGVVQPGVTKWGDLNYDCTGSGDTDCPADSAAGGTPVVGIRFVPLNTDATADGCPCEGWGAADAGSGLTGSANQMHGNANVTPVSLVATPTTVVVTTDISDGALPGYALRVVHDYHPSAISPNLYEVTVRITNIGTQNVADLRYRRVMDWDIEPTPTSEWVTIANTGASRQLLFDSDGGFASSNPLDSTWHLPGFRERLRWRLHGPVRVLQPGSGRRVSEPDPPGRSRRAVRLRLRRSGRSARLASSRRTTARPRRERPRCRQ